VTTQGLTNEISSEGFAFVTWGRLKWPRTLRPKYLAYGKNATMLRTWAWMQRRVVR